MEILVKDEMKTLLGWGIQLFIHDTDTVVCTCYFPMDKKIQPRSYYQLLCQ